MIFIGADGWPCDFADSPTGAALVEAVSRLPGADALSQDAVQSFAMRLFSASEQGKASDEPRSRPASIAQSEREIETLDKLAGELEQAIRSIRKPSHAALFREGANLAEISENLAQLREYARHAYSDLRDAENVRGRPKKHEAAVVTETARHIFETIEKRPATFTTDPASGSVSGIWPDFLSAVFEALAVTASVASQVRK
jgi:hypothetical protein